MKKIYIVVLFLFMSFTVFAQEDAKITISRVRVFLDDVEISAYNSDEVEELNSATISAETVLSFTKIRAGKKMTLKALEKEIQQTQLRLMHSGYFYNATVEIVPPRKNPEKRTIIINVTTGFLNRIGGGGIYAFYGKVVLGGKRNQLLGVAGWNVNGASYMDENLFDLPLIAGVSAYTNAPASFLTKENGISFNGTATLGGFINPNLRFCVDVLGLYNTNLGFVQNDFIISPYLYFQRFINTKLTITTETRMYSKPGITFTDFSGEICQTVNYLPASRLNLAALCCSGVRFGNNSEYDENFVHDLNLEHSAVSGNSGMGKRAIRSGYKSEELLLKNYAMVSLEARWKAFDFVIANTFPCNIRPYIFADGAVGTGMSSETVNFLDAYGLGIQFNFDCPVFAYFNFAYGVNHFGKGKFCFYTGLSF